VKKILKRIKQVYEFGVFRSVGLFLKLFLPYKLVWRWNSFFSYTTENEYDLVYVIHESNRGWILDAICKDISPYFNGKSYFYYGDLDRVPKAKNYFFAHFVLYTRALKLSPWIKGRENFIFYTHPHKYKGTSDRELVDALNLSSKVFVMCTHSINHIVNLGVKSELCELTVGAASKDMFYPHTRNGKTVGISSAFYPRKNPELIFKVISSLPHYNFILLGKNWQQFNRYEEMLKLNNLEYVEAAYSDYPSLYNKMDVYLSLAKLEGGPIPLIESMLSNVVPVATDTGFAADIIKSGENGIIIPVEIEDISQIDTAISRALEIDKDVREDVLKYDWKPYAEKIFSFMS
jgi:glycosyltransferase involved in cell wall biosynthesis